MKKKLLYLICVLAIATSANAALHVRGTDSSGGQLIYDDQQDITWYDFDSGSMTFSNAQTWVDELSIIFNNQVLSDWRLPHLAYGSTPLWNYYNQDPLQAEMGELFYNSLNLTPSTVGNLNDGAFDHLQTSAYWTDVVYNGSYHYTFSFYNYSTPGWGSGSTGRVGTMDNRAGFKVMAVMDGNVIPEPAALSLLGLGGLAFLRRRK